MHKVYTHLYFIPISAPTPVAAELNCESCGHQFGGEVGRWVPTKDRRATLDDLIRETNPGVVDDAAQVQAFFDRAAAGRLCEEERRAAIAKCFASVCLPLTRRVEAANVDGCSAKHLVAAISATCLAVAIWALVGVPAPVGWVMASAAAVPWLLFLYKVHTDGSRFLHRRLLPGMMPQLAALRPTIEDIRWARRNLKQAHIAAYRAIKPKQLLAHLQQQVQLDPGPPLTIETERTCVATAA